MKLKLINEYICTLHNFDNKVLCKQLNNVNKKDLYAFKQTLTTIYKLNVHYYNLNVVMQVSTTKTYFISLKALYCN